MHGFLRRISLIVPLLAAIILISCSNRESDELDISADTANQKLAHDTITFTDSTVFRCGDNLGGLISKVGVVPNETMIASNLLGQVCDVKRIKSGSNLKLCLTDSGLIRIVLTPPRSLVEYRVDRTNDSTYSVYTDSLPVQRELIDREGVITSTFYEALLASGDKPELAIKYIEIFQFVIYFSSETRKGDRFRLIAEELRLGDEILGYGRIYAAQYINGKETQTAVWRPDSTSEFGGDYFNDKGISFRRDLLRAPFQAAKVTSTYGLRKHPITGDVRKHRGIDFGAKTGTPVVSSGSGTITRLVRGNTGLGNWVEVTHGKTGFVTRYGHFSGFPRGLKRGQWVKQGQVIGYVGSSGMATGPHLHYEVKRDGKHINPMKVKGSPTKKLNSTELQTFLEEYYYEWIEMFQVVPLISMDPGREEETAKE